MRSFAEELRSGTIELLFTSPLTDLEIVLGKFFGALALYVIMLGATLVHIGILFYFGDPEWKPIVVGYLGLFLLGAGYIAFGLLFSSMTKNQIIAGFMAFNLFVFLYLIEFAESWGGWAASVVPYLSVSRHLAEFAKGVLDTRDIVYYLSFIGFGVISHEAKHRVLPVARPSEKTHALRRRARPRLLGRGRAACRDAAAKRDLLDELSHRGSRVLRVLHCRRFSELAGLFGRRSAKRGANAVLLILIVAGIVVLVNIIADQQATQWDFTAARQYSLSEQTAKILSELATENDIEIVLLDRRGRSSSCAQATCCNSTTTRARACMSTSSIPKRSPSERSPIRTPPSPASPWERLS